MKKQKHAFTLIELLAVMGIMIMLSAVVVGAYIGMTRGAAARSAVTHLKGVLSEARQMAILRGKKTYVVFQQSDPPGMTEVPYYFLCRHEGTATEGSTGVTMRDRYNDVAELAGATIINLDTVDGDPEQYESKVMSYIQGDNAVQTADPLWSKGAKYGWQLGQRHYLPRGFVFGPKGSTQKPDPIVFGPDGTLLNMNSTPKLGGYKITLYEKINPMYLLGVEVKYVGSVEARFDA